MWWNLSPLCLKAYAASLVGIGDSPEENLNQLFHLGLLISQQESKDDELEFQDIKIADVPVRIYRPKHAGAGKRVTGVIYLHGGGWTYCSVGKSQHCSGSVQCADISTSLTHQHYNNFYQTPIAVASTSNGITTVQW